MKTTRWISGGVLAVMLAGVLLMPFGAEASHRDYDRRDRDNRHCSYNCGGHYYPQQNYSYYYPQQQYYYYYPQPTYYYYPTYSYPTYYYQQPASYSYSYSYSGGYPYWGW